ncbi:MAG: hypothetical protein SGJ00_14430 [bacterium]|nr:hypothetical protein [bacterium]
MTDTTLKLEINSLPMKLQAKVADFVAFLKRENKAKTKTPFKSQ